MITAVERKMIEPTKVNERLRNMFWQGLKPALKDISGYKKIERKAMIRNRYNYPHLLSETSKGKKHKHEITGP